jgi:hypothetical protein
MPNKVSELGAENLRLKKEVAELREALQGVVRVADRKTIEFDRAHAALRSAPAAILGPMRKPDSEALKAAFMEGLNAGWEDNENSMRPIVGGDGMQGPSSEETLWEGSHTRRTAAAPITTPGPLGAEFDPQNGHQPKDIGGNCPTPPYGGSGVRPPAAIGKKMADFTFPQPQRNQVRDVLRRLGEQAIRSQKITDHEAASTAQQEALVAIERLLNTAQSSFQISRIGRQNEGVAIILRTSEWDDETHRCEEPYPGMVVTFDADGSVLNISIEDLAADMAPPVPMV